MADEVVIKVYDSVSGLDFEIPLDSKGTSPFSMSKQLSDLSDLTKRFGVRSSHFSIPISKDIATTYNFFNEAQHHNYKNIDADKLALIIVNGNEIERGKIRIVDYSIKDNEEEVELLFIGNNYDWKELVKNKTMADITWAVDAVAYTPSVIKASWLNTVDLNNDYVFPLESRGGRKLSAMVHTEDFRPAMFFYRILERLLQNAGYTFSSTFLSSTAFKRNVITFFGKRFRIPQATMDLNYVRYGNSTVINNDHLTVNGAGNALRYVSPLNAGRTASSAWDDSTAPNIDAGTNFDPTAGTSYYTPAGTVTSGRYVAVLTGYYKFKVDLEGVRIAIPDFSIPQSTRYDTFHHSVFLYKFDVNNVTNQSILGYNQGNTFIGSVSSTFNASSTQSPFKTSGEIEMYLVAGESVELWQQLHDYDAINNRNSNFVQWMFRVDTCSVKVEIQKTIAEGYTFNLSDVLDDNIKVLDIINDVSRECNLFWDADTTLKKVTVEPRDDFYNSIATAKEITSKINLLKEIKTVYNSSFHKKDFKFAFSKDSSDEFVKKLEIEEARNLGEYTHNLPDKFKEGVNSISTKELAATYIYKDVDSLLPSLSEYAPYTARYWNEYIEAMPVEMLEDHAPRLLNYQYKLQNAVTALDVTAKKFRFYDESNDRTRIPYVMPHQIKDSTGVIVFTDYNLHWNKTNDQDGLYKTYWAKTLTEIISGLKMSCYLWFSQKDWIDFDFRNVAYIREPIDIKGYWLIEKLDNYQPENGGLVRCDLLKRIEYEPQAESGGATIEDPLIGTDTQRMVNTSVPMTVTITDSNSNNFSVNMQSEDSKGDTKILTQ